MSCFSSERVFVWVLHVCFLVLPLFFYKYCKPKKWYGAGSYYRPARRARNAGQETALCASRLSCASLALLHSPLPQGRFCSKLCINNTLLIIYLTFWKKSSFCLKLNWSNWSAPFVILSFYLDAKGFHREKAHSLPIFSLNVKYNQAKYITKQRRPKT